MNIYSIFKSKNVKTATTVLCLTLFASTLSIMPAHAQQSQLSQAQSDRAALEAELAGLETQIAAKQAELATQQGQSQTISRDITILKSKIDKAKLDISAKNLTIKKLGGEITEKSARIETLSEKIDNELDSLGQLLRKTDQMDRRPFLHIIVTGNSLSEFYADVDSFSSVQSAIKKSVNEIRGVRTETEEEKQALQKKQDAEMDAKVALETARKAVERNQAEQKRLLDLSKQKESAYQKDLADKRTKAAQIRARLFQLAGGSAAIPFGDAVAYAEQAQAKTGVAPAFVLAILTQESNLGANVGRCYLTDPLTGAGINVSGAKTYPNVMKPSRDVPPFLEITKNLGMDPYKTAISCPIAGVAGWGGAMGPAQFIASTWKLVEPRLEKSLGVSQANPWIPAHAFMASATYLADLGAAGSSYSAQVRAACKYYGSGGTTCSYGRSVVDKHMPAIQADIDYLKQYGVSKR